MASGRNSNLRPPVGKVAENKESSNGISQRTTSSRFVNVQSKLNTGISNPNSGISSIKQNDSLKQNDSNLDGDLSISSQGESSRGVRGKSKNDLKSQFGGKVSMDQDDIKGTSLQA